MFLKPKLKRDYFIIWWMFPQDQVCNINILWTNLKLVLMANTTFNESIIRFFVTWQHHCVQEEREWEAMRVRILLFLSENIYFLNQTMNIFPWYFHTLSIKLRTKFSDKSKGELLRIPLKIRDLSKGIRPRMKAHTAFFLSTTDKPANLSAVWPGFLPNFRAETRKTYTKSSRSRRARQHCRRE